MPGLRKRTRPSSSRCRTKAGGDQYGQGLRSASYTPNNLNQYTSRTVPGGFDVVGVANNAATVRVDGSDVQYRRGEYWRQYVSVDNTGMPVWRSVSVTTTGGGSATGGVFVPKTAEVFGYDLDGNIISDGRWTYVWDGENRLIQMTANTTVGPQQRIDFEYDWQGRRIRKTVTNLATSTVILDYKFLYNGWNLIAELNADNNNVIRSYAWGLDLSGSFQGAGGVGRLLMVKDAANGTHFAAYDLNGNVMGLVNAVTGVWSAQYEYGPFGEVIRSTGSMAKLNPIRWSTKYQDDETDLVYYGYRFYSPSMGRWLNQDPLGERGGMNLYGFVGNSPVHSIDRVGLEITYFYGNETSSFLYPNGSVPYLDGETAWEMLIASAYNVIPLLNNAYSKLFEPFEYFIDQAGQATTDLTGDPNAGDGVKNTLFATSLVMGNVCSAQARAAKAPPGRYRPPSPLPRGPNGEMLPSSSTPHTQLGTEVGRKVGPYTTAREFGENGEWIKDIHFTDHGRPNIPGHVNPHQHPAVPNPTGGTPGYGPAEPFVP